MDIVKINKNRKRNCDADTKFSQCVAQVQKPF